MSVERAVDIVLLGPLRVIGHKEVELAVLIVVHPGSAGAKAGVVHSGGFGNVLERAVALVVQEARFAEAGDVDIVPTVVVVIADGDAHAVDFNPEPRLRGHVGKRSVAVVVVKPKRGVLADVAGKILAAHEHNVGFAVVIVVDEGATRAHGLGQEFLSKGPGVVNEADPGLARDIDKVDGFGGRRGQRRPAISADRNGKQGESSNQRSGLIHLSFRKASRKDAETQSTTPRDIESSLQPREATVPREHIPTSDFLPSDRCLPNNGFPRTRAPQTHARGSAAPRCCLPDAPVCKAR